MGNFYRKIELDRIVEPYQNAFADWPWYEVSKCVDEQVSQRCGGGLSSLQVGQLCGTCERTPKTIAYEPKELVGKFSRLGETFESRWYIEEVEGDIALAAFAFKATAMQIVAEKYADVPTMNQWLEQQTNESEVIWLDEVFANKAVRTKGNLDNFGVMNRGFGDELSSSTVMYRTTNPAMVRAALRDFAGGATVYEAGRAVPDRREFITLKLEEAS